LPTNLSYWQRASKPFAGFRLWRAKNLSKAPDFGLADSRHPALASLGEDMGLWHDEAGSPVITPEGRAGEGGVRMTIAVRRLFNHNWSVVWATTYTCGVVEFDEYFRGQLCPDDLNVTILADLGALTETWSAMKETSGPSRLRRVNRAYLLRPVAWYGHAFHPTTYMFGNEHVGLLLVGSGNHNPAQGTPVGRFYQRLGRAPLR
jgi:hypothetical protein